ncbi:hypothetical protein CFT9_15262 [Pseudomonas sp. CFT9]|uniref:Uncharacterized protein n=1 Tax=Pseudomonas gorinensis TaxID=3240790 RepID=A0ACA7P0V2_9PSED|nr:hypothetical protein U771_04795 [Pseudomonas sp. TKP]EPJ82720.1 hypothetical protein CFT9_15262 [Pseudomonas sp. CFT9]
MFFLLWPFYSVQMRAIFLMLKKAVTGAVMNSIGTRCAYSKIYSNFR